MSTILEDEPQKIRQRMQRLRRRMDRDFQGVVEQTQRIFDWKDYVRQFPLGTITLGILAGYLISPGRKVIPSVKLADESVKELVEQGIGARQADASTSSSASSPLVSTMISTLSGIAFSSLATIVRYKIEQYLTSDAGRSSNEV